MMMMMIKVKAIIKLKKLFKLERKTISFNHTYLKMISDLQMTGLMMLVIIYMFSIYRYTNCAASQPIKVEFKFDGFVPNDVNGHALVLTNKLVSISSDG